jgi:hypothetical protein
LKGHGLRGKCANNITIIEGFFEVKLSTIWTNGKAEVGRVREIEGARRKKMQVRKKVGKPPNTLFFQ